MEPTGMAEPFPVQLPGCEKSGTESRLKCQYIKGGAWLWSLLSETPVAGECRLVALRPVHADVPLQRLLAGISAIEASKNPPAELALCHVQPAEPMRDLPVPHTVHTARKVEHPFFKVTCSTSREPVLARHFRQ